MFGLGERGWTSSSLYLLVYGSVRIHYFYRRSISQRWCQRQQQRLEICCFRAAETLETATQPVPNLQPTHQDTGDDSLADTEPFGLKKLTCRR